MTKYFGAWANIMLAPQRRYAGDDRIAYIDLFSGPGSFKDGSPSTPLLILQQAINDPRLCKRLVTMFTDENRNHVEQLQIDVAGLSGISQLAHKPDISRMTVGRDFVATLRDAPLIPTLFFIDPWGYKGLSVDLIGEAIRSWGCDCIFFFNYNRFNAALNHPDPSIAELVDDVLGAARAARLRRQVSGQEPEERKIIILDELVAALADVGGRHVISFEFESEQQERPSHYVVFVSKHFVGYHLMKEVMFPLSSDQGEVRSFRHVPIRSPQMQMLAEYGRPHSVEALRAFLISTYVGQSRTVWQVYEQSTVGTPYMLRHVQEALIALEAAGRLKVQGSTRGRTQGGKTTLAKDRTVTFLH